MSEAEVSRDAEHKRLKEELREARHHLRNQTEMVEQTQRRLERQKKYEEEYRLAVGAAQRRLKEFERTS